MCVCVWHDSFTCVTCNIFACDMTAQCQDAPKYLWRDPFVFTGRNIPCTREIFFIFITWRIHMCDMTHSRTRRWFTNMWHNSRTGVMGPICFYRAKCLLYSCVCVCGTQDSFTSVTWIKFTFDMNAQCLDAPKYLWRDPYVFIGRHCVCCRVLQCVAVCCSVLQCVAVCCSVLQCVVVCRSDPFVSFHVTVCLYHMTLSALQCVAVHCSVL